MPHDASPLSVILVTLRPGADPTALLAVRATPLPVAGRAPDGLRRYLLDEVPGDVEAVAARLRAERWCHSARTALVCDAESDDTVPVWVADPVLGTLCYHTRRVEPLGDVPTTDPTRSPLPFSPSPTPMPASRPDRLRTALLLALALVASVAVTNAITGAFGAASYHGTHAEMHGGSFHGGHEGVRHASQHGQRAGSWHHGPHFGLDHAPASASATSPLGAASAVED